jgi:hypothetical protein
MLPLQEFSRGAQNFIFPTRNRIAWMRAGLDPMPIQPRGRPTSTE